MFEVIRKFWNSLLYGEPREEISLSRKRHIENDDFHSRTKRRCIETPSLFRQRMTSDQFLCPARDFITKNTMATGGLFPLEQNSHSYICDRKKQETKENLISISDDETEDEYNSKSDKQVKSKPEKWYEPKRFSKSELFNTLTKTAPKLKEQDNDIEFVKEVESTASRVRRQGGMVVEVPTSRYFSLQRRALLDSKDLYSKYMKGADARSKSRNRIPVPSKRPSTLNSALNMSIRLEEKKKYHELLQSVRGIPQFGTTRFDISQMKLSLGDAERKSSLGGIAKNEDIEPVEVIDLTGPQPMERRVDVEKKSHGVQDKSAIPNQERSKSFFQAKIEEPNDLERRVLTSPLYDKNWIRDISMMYDHKSRDSRRLVEQEQQKLDLSRKKAQDMMNDSLEEQMRLHMKLSEVAVEEEIIVLDDEEKTKLPKLAAHMERVINATFRRDPPGEVLVEAFGQRITRKDIHTLTGSNWLNDEVINFYMNILIERGKQDKYPSMYGFNTFFYPKLASNGHASLKRWTRKVDIFAHEILIVPVHLGVHWCMAAINLEKKTIKYYDSMGGENNKCLRDLLKYLKDEMMDKKKRCFDTSGWSAMNVQDVPQQMNGSDCGMFACMYAEFICRRAKISFTQSDMPYFRRKMAYEIVTKKLLL